VDTLTAARRFFGDLVAASVGATDPRIADVFAKVPREDFLGPGPWLTYVGDSDEAIATPSADPSCSIKTGSSRFSPKSI
jgi:protein-L-isoaspartate(D-aspartate) O-methyltransferase